MQAVYNKSDIESETKPSDFSFHNSGNRLKVLPGHRTRSNLMVAVRYSCFPG